MFERFSSDARAVVVAAEQRARDLGDDYVRPQHLLLGILDQTDSFAVSTLVEVGVDLDAVRDDLVAAKGRSDAGSPSRLPFTPEAKAILARSLREALDAGADRIAAEHLLLAVLREADTPTVQILARRGGDPTHLRAALLHERAGPTFSETHRGPWWNIGGRRFGGPSPEIAILTALQAQLDRLEREVTRLAQIVDRLPHAPE